MSLVLPPPVNPDEGETLIVATDKVENGEDLPVQQLKSESYKKNLIYPPPEIRTLIDKTAGALHKSANPLQLESKIKEGQKADPKFSFLNSSDPYHTYYLFMQARLAEGLVVDAPVVQDGETGPGRQDGGNEGLLEDGNQRNRDEDGKPVEPRALGFLTERPGMPPVDLDILKLTALFTARRGRAFLSSLSQREGRNYQFDFLRPTHSLYSLFQRMVQMYTSVLAPPTEALEELEIGSQRTGGRKVALGQAKQRSEWDKWRSERSKAKEEAKEAQRVAFAQIDWQDFVVVETIEFTSADEQIELPPPTSVSEMENMTLAQKRMASMVMETEPVPEEEAEQATNDDMEMDMEEETEEAEETEEQLEEKRKKAESDRAREVQRKFAEQQGTMKIKKDYVPKARQPQIQVQTTICSYCGQHIPIDEISEHIRIELLDPKWKERKQELDARKTQAGLLQKGADVSASLRELASARTDMFGTDTEEDLRKRQEDEERQKRKEREKIIWDGHTASKVATVEKFQTGSNLDLQIEAIHRAKGLSAVANAAGPTVGPGPSAFPQPPPPSSTPNIPTGPAIPGLPANPMHANTFSSGPQPPSGPSGSTAYQQPPPPSAPAAMASGSYSSAPMPMSAIPQGAAPSIHPSRLAALAAEENGGGSSPVSNGGGASPVPNGGASPAPAAGTAQGRPREEDEGADGPDAKRPKIAPLAEGTYHPEATWIALNPGPVSLSITLPSNIDGKPELDGSTVTLPALPPTTTISALRERVQEMTRTTLAYGKMRFDLSNGKIANNNKTLASLNLSTGDVLVLGIKK